MGTGKTVKVCVFGLWHLGSVTAACMADRGFVVAGLDSDPDRVGDLKKGVPPVFEPGLERLIKRGLSGKKLSFTTDAATALEGTDVLWITFDTPVDEEDRADSDHVAGQIKKIFPHLRSGMVLLISSQLPVGTTARLEKEFSAGYPDKKVVFAYSPENLRLGTAIESFTNPHRIVAGVRDGKGRKTLEGLFAPFCGNVEWMSVESAEMTKHALNAFLAMSIAFINELATLCENVGADAREVERGLKSDPRIGARAYLTAGAAFAGGTLARDVVFLDAISRSLPAKTPLLSAVNASNQKHKLWAFNKLKAGLGDLAGKTVGVLGLTYKAGTNTLRRSGSIELCETLAKNGARVKCHDPSLKKLPQEYEKRFMFSSLVKDVIKGADALVVATEWPDYKKISAGRILQGMRRPIVIDANRFLEGALGNDRRILYFAVGRPDRRDRCS